MAAAEEATAFNRITRSRRSGLNRGRMLLCHRWFDWRRVSIGPCGSCWSRSLSLNWPPSKQTRSKRDGCRGRLRAALTERNRTSRGVGPAYAEPVAQSAVRSSCWRQPTGGDYELRRPAPRTRRCQARLVQVQAGHFDRRRWRREDTRGRAGGKGPQARLSARRVAGRTRASWRIRHF